MISYNMQQLHLSGIKFAKNSLNNIMQTTDILNDLILINNDRVAGYEKANKQLHDSDTAMRDHFIQMIKESRNYNAELAGLVVVTNSDVKSGTTVSGKLYRTWLDVKGIFTSDDRKTVLQNCVAGETAAQKAYIAALQEDLPANVKKVVQDQLASLKLSGSNIEHLLDAEN
jgi:uncharacterized protein (TIGR02284 family)